tara:strand:- start:638 stop:973 length:336 start_codon:yes stop_codon:yes gene_type:complete
MDIIQIVKGDTGPSIRTSLTRQDTGAAFDVVGHQVQLHIRKKGTTNVISSIAASSSNTLPAGDLLFPLEAFLTDSNCEEGFYEAEVELTLPDNKIMSTFELINIKVRNDFT